MSKRRGKGGRTLTQGQEQGAAVLFEAEGLCAGCARRLARALATQPLDSPAVAECGLGFVVKAVVGSDGRVRAETWAAAAVHQAPATVH